MAPIIQELHTTPRVMTFAEYAAIDAVNWSTLREMGRSPAHYRYRLDHPREDTPRLGLGRGAHAALLEPDRFALEFAIFKGPRRAGKEWQAFKAVHAAETILKESEYLRCLAMRDAVHAHPGAAKYLRLGRAERTITWVDAETGLRCKARLDWLSAAPEELLDLKGTDDLSRFGHVAARFGYHCQLAWYLRGLRALGHRLRARIVAVETKPPHAVWLVTVREDALRAGEQECTRLLRKVAECRARNAWPQEYRESALELPWWAFRVEDDRARAKVG